MANLLAQDQQRRHLRHPITDRGDAQRTQLPIGLGDKDPPHRLRSVPLALQMYLQTLQERRYAAGRAFNLLEGHAVEAGRAAVCPRSLRLARSPSGASTGRIAPPAARLATT
jgi:hypothetical protein